jgi:hypothetical protein
MAEETLQVGDIHAEREQPGADSDDSSHRFRPKPASYSDRSQPGIPMIPAGWRRGS